MIIGRIEMLRRFLKNRKYGRGFLISLTEQTAMALFRVLIEKEPVQEHINFREMNGIPTLC